MTVTFELLRSVLVSNGLVTAFAFVGVTVWLSYLVSDKLTRGRVHGSAIAILIGLALAYAGGVATGGDRGLADIEVLAGVGILGGAMIRDLAIVATAFGVDLAGIAPVAEHGINDSAHPATWIYQNIAE